MKPPKDRLNSAFLKNKPFLRKVKYCDCASLKDGKGPLCNISRRDSNHEFV